MADKLDGQILYASEFNTKADKAELATKVDLTEAGADALINKLSTGLSVPNDNDYFISQYVGGGDTTTTYHRRPLSKLYEYLKGKADQTLINGSNNLITSKTIFSAEGAKFLINKIGATSSAISDKHTFIVTDGSGNIAQKTMPILNNYIISKADTAVSSSSTNLIKSNAVYNGIQSEYIYTSPAQIRKTSTVQFPGTVDFLSALYVPYLSSNRLYGLGPDAIQIEHSTDGGENWSEDTTITKENKMHLFDGTRTTSFYIGNKDSKADNSTSLCSRITLDLKNLHSYAAINSIYHWISNNGNVVVFFLEFSLDNNKFTPWDSFPSQGVTLGGWGGPNIWYLPQKVFIYNGNSNHIKKIRLTYKQTDANSNYSPGLIKDIRLFGTAFYDTTTKSESIKNMQLYKTPYAVSEYIDTNNSQKTRFSLPVHDIYLSQSPIIRSDKYKIEWNDSAKAIQISFV